MRNGVLVDDDELWVEIRTRDSVLGALRLLIQAACLLSHDDEAEQAVREGIGVLTGDLVAIRLRRSGHG